MKKSIFMKILKITIIPFILVIIVDYFNIPAVCGLKMNNINYEVFNVIFNSLIVVGLYIITYMSIDKHQIQKDYDAKIIAYVLMKSTYEKCVDFLRIVDDDETRTKYIVPKVEFDKIATESLVIVNLQNNPFTEYTSILEFSVNGAIPYDDLYSYVKIMNMYKRYISIRITFYDIEQYHETKHIALKERLQFDRIKLNDLLNKEIIKMQKFIGE